MQDDRIDNQMLGSFIDGELDAAGSQLVLQAMEKDAEVRERVYRLRRAKDLMKLGFGHAEPPAKGNNDVRKTGWLVSRGLAASVAALAIAFGAGLLGYQAGKQAEPGGSEITAHVANEQPHRVILHISEANPAHFARALEYARDYISEYESRGGEVAVVAHSTGIDLMRSGVSPFEAQIRKIIATHDNIHFIACANAIRALRSKGIDPVIMPEVDTSKPAMDQIIEHVQDGWDYIKVKSLVSET